MVQLLIFNAGLLFGCFLGLSSETKHPLLVSYICLGLAITMLLTLAVGKIITQRRDCARRLNRRT